MKTAQEYESIIRHITSLQDDLQEHESNCEICNTPQICENTYDLECSIHSRLVDEINEYMEVAVCLDEQLRKSRYKTLEQTLRDKFRATSELLEAHKKECQNQDDCPACFALQAEKEQAEFNIHEYIENINPLGSIAVEVDIQTALEAIKQFENLLPTENKNIDVYAELIEDISYLIISPSYLNKQMDLSEIFLLGMRTGIALEKKKN